MKKNKEETEKEWYTIRYDFFDGEYWKRHKEETITLESSWENRKNNHELAKHIFLENHKAEKVEVTSVSYN